MDFEQLKSDLGGLTRIAKASRDRLTKLVGRLNAVQEKLSKVLADAEPVEPLVEPSVEPLVEPSVEPLVKPPADDA